MATYQELLIIQDRDPDGWQHNEPTEQDYKRFEQWVIANFGEDALREYKGSNWAERSHE